MRKRKICTLLMAAALAVMVLMAACGPADSLQDTKTVSARELSQSLLDKYGQEDRFVYNEPLHDLPQDQVLLYNIEFDPLEFAVLDPENPYSADFSQIADVFVDLDLTVSVKPNIWYNDATGDLCIGPPDYPVYGPDYGSLFSFSQDSNSYDVWGFAREYYAVKFYSPTGEKLEKPVITLFTVQNDLSAPKIEYSVHDDGRLKINWQPVPGADEYRFLHVTTREKEGRHIVDAKITTEPEERYVGETSVFSGGIAMNVFLFLGDANSDFFCVQAIKDGHYSPVSLPVKIKDLMSVLPYRVTSGDSETDSLRAVDYINELSVFKKVLMLDGNEVLMPVTYDIYNAIIDDISFLNTPLDSRNPYAWNNLYEETVLLSIPFKVNGTLITGNAYVRYFDEETLQEDLQRLKQREQEVVANYGFIEALIDFDRAEEKTEPIQAMAPMEDTDFKVFATSAFSEYLAINMLNGLEEIDISNFNERFDTEVIWTACFEATYQNPLILGVTSYGTNKKRSTLYVEYEQSRTDQQQKQNALTEEVAKVVQEIIAPGMNDLEKELTINNYLCSTAVYDFAALESAEENNFEFVDPKFNDSFTAYGVLINKVGVCASYAAAFKLLADEADLPCIVVAGNMYGNLPHAWNRVLVEGEWMTVDSTNNTGEEMPNVLFNIPDVIAKTVLVEGDKFISPLVAANYKGSKEDLEYYRLEGLYYSQEDIVKMLADGLKNKGFVTLRTDYELTDKQFYSIVVDVVKNGGFSADQMLGGHWLGTVYLALTE